MKTVLNGLCEGHPLISPKRTEGRNVVKEFFGLPNRSRKKFLNSLFDQHFLRSVYSAKNLTTPLATGKMGRHDDDTRVSFRVGGRE